MSIYTEEAERRAAAYKRIVEDADERSKEMCENWVSGPIYITKSNRGVANLYSSKISDGTPADFCIATIFVSRKYAHLFAAAPEMAEALRQIINEMQAWQSMGSSRPATWTESRLKLMRAALAKAEGRDSE